MLACTNRSAVFIMMKCLNYLFPSRLASKQSENKLKQKTKSLSPYDSLVNEYSKPMRFTGYLILVPTVSSHTHSDDTEKTPPSIQGRVECFPPQELLSTRRDKVSNRFAHVRSQKWALVSWLRNAEMYDLFFKTPAVRAPLRKKKKKKKKKKRRRRRLTYYNIIQYTGHW